MDYVDVGFIALLVVGYGLVSARLSTTIVSGPMLFVAAGLLLSDRGLDVVDFDVGGTVLEGLIELTLMLVLFTDASRIDLTRLRDDASLPGRMLLIGLPLTILLGAVLARLLFPDLLLGEVLLVGTMLAATDAALGQAVVSDPRLPVRVRQTLNIESGLNDGIALPLVTIFLALSAAEEAAGLQVDWVVFVLEQIGFGLAVGVMVGAAGGLLITWASGRSLMTPGFQQLATMGLAVAAWAFASALGGNGFIAAFVAGAAFGLVARPHCPHIEDFIEHQGNLLSLLTFLVFGGAFAATVLDQLTWRIALYALLSLTAVRMVAVAVSLVGTGLHIRTVAFLGWFGPRGLASILFMLLVAEEELAGGETILLVVAATVLLSVFAHGMTANPATARYARYLAGMGDEYEQMPEAEPAHEHGLRLASPSKALRRARAS